MNKIYPQVIGGRLWSAIQLTTAAGVCSVLDTVLARPDAYQGLVLMERFALDEILENRFGRRFAHGGSRETSGRLVAAGQTERADATPPG